MLIDRIRKAHCARDTGLLIRYLGLETGQPLSLRLAGSADGLTAERVRQVVANVRQSLTFMALPEFAELSGYLDVRTPCYSGSLTFPIEKSSGLQSSAGQAFHVEGLLRLAEFSGHPTRFHARTLKGFKEKIILSDQQGRLFDLYYDLFYAGAARAGALSPARLRDAALAKGRDASIETAQAFFASLEKLGLSAIPCGSSERWLGLPDSPGLPVVRIMRLLQAIPSFEISPRVEEKIVYAGLHEHEKLPRPVLSARLERENIRIDDNVVKYEHGAFVKSENAQLEITNAGDSGLTILRMIEIIRAFGGRMPKKAFFNACMQSGIKLATARVYGYNSGLFMVAGEEIGLPFLS